MREAFHATLSLRNRLAISLIGGAAILTLLLFFGVRSYAIQIAQHSQDSILDASVSSILDAAVIRNGTVDVDFPYSSFSMLGTSSDDRIFYAIRKDGKLLTGYDSLPFKDVPAGSKSQSQTLKIGQTSVRVATKSRTLVGSDVRTKITVSVGQTQDAMSETLTTISRNIGLLGVGFFMFSVVLSFAAASNTIAPLKRLTSSVARRGPQDLTPVASPVPSELAPLVSSLNTLMARLDQSLTQSEDFIAEAAHRVRTPLATVRSYAEATLQRVNGTENRRALRSMVRAIDESSRAAGQLLDHAMITFRADKLDYQDVDLTDLVRELTLRLAPVAEMKDIDLRLKEDGVVTTLGDPILLQNAVRNLIDNALKYSPADSVIDIVVTGTPKSQVIISDQGPGFPEDEISVLSNRFERGRNASGITGSGLGLTIALDVAKAHGGTLILKNREQGGACVTFSV